LNKKVIIVEFYNSHSEVLYSTVEFFNKSGYEVHIWLNDIQKYNSELTPYVTLNYHKSNTHISRIFFILRLISYIRKNDIGLVFINTADGLQVRNFCIASLLFKYEVSGILHIADRLLSSTTQKIISRKLKKYFVLSHYILKNIKAINISGLKFGVFYPLKINYKSRGKKKSDDKFVISIPGEISPYRKSYFGLIEILRKHKDELPVNVKFELLGTVRIDEGKAVIEKIYEYGLNDYFILYNKFIPDEKYYEQCELADIIMPLIHPDVDNFENYLKYQITGAYDIAYIFKKPLIMHSSFKIIDDFNGFTVYYDEDNLIEILNTISKDKKLLGGLMDYYASLDRFEFEVQRNNFIQIIES